MNLPIAISIVLGAAVVAAAVLVFAHRKAKRPLFADSGRGRPMITVTGTIFAVVLAFVIFAVLELITGLLVWASVRCPLRFAT